MIIGVISDIHENFHNLILALHRLEEEGVTQILCLGDLMNAGVAKILAAHTVPTYLIWGNNDGEKVDIVKASYRPNSKLTVSLNTYDFIEFDNRKIFISHYDDLAMPMAESGRYDAVFYGHTHIKSKQIHNDCLVINPGELSAMKSKIASIAIYDTVTNEGDIIDLDGSFTLKTDLVEQWFADNMDRLGFRSKDSFNQN